MDLDHARRLGSLAYQLTKEAKRLRSIETRARALLAEADLPATDPPLAAEVMATLERVLAQAQAAAATITVTLATLATARQASATSDHTPERDCED